MDEVRYYNSSITLEEAEQYIQSGLVTAARAYVANGYYLRRIREDRLFEGTGYQNFEDYVRGKYNKDKGWASKCIKVNQQLSEGGDSPILSKQYLEYSTYQLVELAYMTEEQREEADPDMTVNQLKQIRKPEEAVESEKSCDVTTSVPEEEQEFLKEEQSLIERGCITGLSPYGVCSCCGHEGAKCCGECKESCNGRCGWLEDTPEKKMREEQNQEIPSQENLGYYNPDDDKNVDESYSFAGIPKASDRHVTMFAQLFVQDNAKRLIYGGMAIGITDERIIEMLKLRYSARKEDPIIIDNNVEVSVAAEIIEFYRNEEDLGICLFQKFSNYVRKQINEYIDNKLAEEKKDLAQEQEPEKGLKGNVLNSIPTSCPHREEYSCTVLTENKSIPGDGSKCGSSCCWSCKFQGMCKFECNASACRDGALPEYDAAWFVKQWAKKVPEEELEGVLKACRESSNNADRAKAVQKEISPYGAYSQHCWEYNFSFHGFAGGMDFRIGKVEMHLKYGRFVQELSVLYPDFEEPEKVPKQSESLLEAPETVIDGNFVEILSEQELSARSILEEEKAELHNWIEAFKGEEEELPPAVERRKIIVAALAAMVCKLETVEKELVKPEQPELPILKNNEQRAAFIDAYETWPIWIETKETGERYYRYDLSEKAAIVVKVYWKHSWESYKESKDYEYGAAQYYLLGVKSEWHNGKNVSVEDKSRTFYECGTNRSALVEYLKEFQKSK